jgi:NAD(P)-dependent dehydrogenase (short-subunit alcohol dehydrogenase family)
MSTETIATRPLEPEKRAIVIGASSGIGAALAQRLAQHGYFVAALAPDETGLKKTAEGGNGRIRTYLHDVTHYDEIPALFQQIAHDLGGVNLVAYIAGVQPIVALDEYNFEKDAAMIRVNLLGAIAWLNQAALRFERAKSGHILAVSSVAGDRGRVGAPGYNTSKAGLSTYLEALRNRLSRHGVTVTTIKFGFVNTALLENAAKTFWVISPEEAARQIHNAVEKKRQTVYAPARWGLVALIIRHIPSFIFRRMSF